MNRLERTGLMTIGASLLVLAVLGAVGWLYACWPSAMAMPMPMPASGSRIMGGGWAAAKHTRLPSSDAEESIQEGEDI